MTMMTMTRCSSGSGCSGSDDGDDDILLSYKFHVYYNDLNNYYVCYFIYPTKEQDINKC